MSASVENQNQSVNYDDIEGLVSNDQLRPTPLSCISQVQKKCLSMQKSTANGNSSDVSTSKENQFVLTVKTSNIPGPVGLLPRLVRKNRRISLKYFH